MKKLPPISQIAEVRTLEVLAAIGYLRSGNNRLLRQTLAQIRSLTRAQAKAVLPELQRYYEAHRAILRPGWRERLHAIRHYKWRKAEEG